MKYRLEPLKNSTNLQVSIPGSKSYTNRSLILAALTPGEVKIDNPLFSDDTQAMMDCLKVLGIEISKTKDYILVNGDISQVKNNHFELNANLSGTTIRFILALACIVPGVKKIFGEGGLNKRPIGELVLGLRQLGAEIEYLESEGFPPLLVKSSKLNPGITKLNGDISSQYFSAILMVAPVIGNVSIEVIGEQISKPYIDMTMDTMAFFGANVINEDYHFYKILKAQQYNTKEYIVEGDFSSAGYFAAVAILTNSTITLKNLNPKSKQADRRFLDILKAMGTEVLEAENEITIIGHGVKPLSMEMEDCPDQVQTLAVLAAFAKGKTEITGARSLRVKETERVKALENELKKMGIKTESSFDSLTIYGGDPKPVSISTYGDHRMAMSFAVAGTKMSGIVIEDPEVVTKTFPEFWDKLTEIGVKIEKS